MGTTVDKLNKLKVTKEAIRVAINNKGGTLTENDTFASYPTAIENIQTGETDIYVDYLDGDGTLLKREYLNEGDTTTPPSDPNLDNEYLIFDGWSDTEYTNITESKTIYAKYITKDNATYIFIHISSIDKEITLNFSGTITSINWGDGTVNTTLSHVYSTIGDYVIKVIGGTIISYYILGNSNNNQFVLKCYISNNITHIDDDAFIGCYSLKYIILSDGLIDIGSFGGCSISDIIIPTSMTNIRSNAFTSCHSLATVILPNSITNIDSNAFYDCYSLKSIKLPNTITSINVNTFYDCYTLDDIKLPSSITYIGGGAFYYCRSLKNITLPNDIITIDNGAFYGCTSLTNINLPSNLININSNVFNSCYSLANINLPNSVINIGSGAFQNCYSLTRINLPNNIESIGYDAFNSCYSLININLPASVIDIGSNTFNNCYSLEKVIINAEIVITIQSNSFSSKIYGTKFYVPDNLVKDYKVATNWVNFADRIYPISSLPKE